MIINASTHTLCPLLQHWSLNISIKIHHCKPVNESPKHCSEPHRWSMTFSFVLDNKSKKLNNSVGETMTFSFFLSVSKIPLVWPESAQIQTFTPTYTCRQVPCVELTVQRTAGRWSADLSCGCRQTHAQRAAARCQSGGPQRQLHPPQDPPASFAPVVFCLLSVPSGEYPSTVSSHPKTCKGAHIL